MKRFSEWIKGLVNPRVVHPFFQEPMTRLDFEEMVRRDYPGCASAVFEDYAMIHFLANRPIPQGALSVGEQIWDFRRQHGLREIRLVILNQEHHYGIIGR